MVFSQSKNVASCRSSVPDRHYVIRRSFDRHSHCQAAEVKPLHLDSDLGTSEEFLPDVDGRALADGVEVGGDPAVRDLTAALLEVQQKVHAGVEFARRAEPVPA